MMMEDNNQTADEQAIRELMSTWMAATKAGDMQTVLSLMTDDVVFLTPGNQPFGKEAFKQAAGTANNVTYEGSSEIEELKVLGDWAYARSRLRVSTVPHDGSAPVTRSGYTLTIFRKEPDGKWRICRDANLLSASK